ncbi:hypothetical protein KZ829_21965 [Actinoplanes hulinensis]|uniref:Uncharacterized protein n=1 Tax=Actinoplanes hulinensis TaxID=1144547 RepID=A0ABS7B602_9ACTN|nr:hypothetical protein [Actinoplanes hulinensis]MBW6436410.1 hypothetical protein [Actinoplanes hulinensis]
MHHPRRRERIPPLVSDCAPLTARVITDPDPDGVPSPLRTAKVAWRSIEDGATHHLVLQDDIVLIQGFATQLHRAVSARPGHGISLYSHWDSPQNSYLVRRAVIAGWPFAPLSRSEWTPTQGFVLPVALARDLADYLAGIPDDVKDDDEMVVRFCREAGIPVVGTVPHLVDHRFDPTIVGHPGRFHATVFLPAPVLSADYWRLSASAEAALDRRCGSGEKLAYTIQLHRSRCLMRPLRPGTGEPVEHGFGWYWADHCGLIGVSAGDVVNGFDAFLGTRDPAPEPHWRLALEVWAAGYLLGADAVTVRRGEAAGVWPPAAVGAGLAQAAMTSWISSGLAGQDAAGITARGRSDLIATGLAGVSRGWLDGWRAEP